MSPHGEYELSGHRRLSLVDIDGGNQPFVHGAATLVANGEDAGVEVVEVLSSSQALPHKRVEFTGREAIGQRRCRHDAPGQCRCTRPSEDQ